MARRGSKVSPGARSSAPKSGRKSASMAAGGQSLEARGDVLSSGKGATDASQCQVADLAPDLLRRRWRIVMGRAPPRGLSRALMIRILVWQEEMPSVGDLDPRTRAILAKALDVEKGSRGVEASTGNALPAASGGTARPASKTTSLRPGPVLVREHGGPLHAVTVLPEGFSWRGETFASLSAVARAITGTNWNGHRFFGLARKKEKQSAEPDVPASKASNDTKQVGERARAVAAGSVAATLVVAAPATATATASASATATATATATVPPTAPAPVAAADAALLMRHPRRISVADRERVP